MLDQSFLKLICLIGSRFCGIVHVWVKCQKIIKRNYYDIVFENSAGNELVQFNSMELDNGDSMLQLMAACCQRNYSL